ncbi:UNKNOWN [Stylonychia lemnae]|uniref:Uncharacterized protein n=1 Tax=Stylonychia lemnae TaxID=5949 RepID=A0A078AWU4_STYLE|nr:UNKNOWN [Stylonychia lemnae]|eukprot:CDW86526.1 UNKNOWN [Stylonychia lemnae]
MGAICCSNSLDRKDDSYYEPNYSRFQNSNSYKRQHQKLSSPGKPTGDSDAFWELTDDLINKHETDIMFICNYQGFKPILNTLQVKVNVNDDYPPLDDVIRTNIVLGFHKFEVIPDTCQVKATLLLQIDLKNPDLELTQYEDMNLEMEAAESAGRIHMRLVSE